MQGAIKSLHPCLLALVIREVDKATKGENGNDDVEHSIKGYKSVSARCIGKLGVRPQKRNKSRLRT